MGGVARVLSAAAVVAATTGLQLRLNRPPFPAAVTPSDPYAGRTLSVEAPASPGAFCLYAGKRYPFMRTRDGRWRALVPIPLEEPAGRRPLLAFDGASSRLAPARSAQAWLDVRRLELPLRTIRLPKGKLKLFEDPHVPEARKTIEAALGGLSGDQLWSGLFALPVDGRRTSPFGSPRRLTTGKRYVHKGLDLAAPLGAPVSAPNRGVVLLAGEFPLQGRLVLIDHGQGVMSMVQHLRSIKARPGDAVEKGTLLGSVGSEGISTGSHVHWGLYVHGQPVDPEEWTRRTF